MVKPVTKMHLYASMPTPPIRDLEPFAIIHVTSDTAAMHGSTEMRREIVGKIRQRSSMWYDFMNYWTPLRQDPIESDGKTYYAVQFIKVDYDFYANFTWLNVVGDTLRLILKEEHHGTLEAWEKKKEKRTKRVEDFLRHVRSGQFTRNDYRELMNFERIDTPHMNETFSAQEMGELLKGIERFPVWQRKTRNTIK